LPRSGGYRIMVGLVDLSSWEILMLERRRLTFDRIEDIMPEVDRLIAGHATVGRWTLGAICDHLAKTIILALDAAPTDPPTTREQAVYRRLFFRAGAFPEGQAPPLHAQMPSPDADLVSSTESLRNAVAQLVAHHGSFRVHPMLGPLTRDEWLLFHTRHAAHHLSFAVPTSPSD
jgi:Protein of unknown function (DUF1569)